MYHSNDAPIQAIWNDPEERFGEVPPDDPGAEGCAWCQNVPEGGQCGASEPGNDNEYECTRKIGHTGKHVACGGAGLHKLAIWE